MGELYRRMKQASLWKWSIGVMLIAVGISFLMVEDLYEYTSDNQERDRKVINEVGELPIRERLLQTEDVERVELGSSSFPIYVEGTKKLDKIGETEGNSLVLAKNGYRYRLNGGEDKRLYGWSDQSVKDVFYDIDFNSYIYDSIMDRVKDIGLYGLDRLMIYVGVVLGIIMVGSTITFIMERKREKVKNTAYVGNMLVGTGMLVSVSSWVYWNVGEDAFIGSMVIGFVVMMGLVIGLQEIRRRILEKVTL